MTLDPLAFLRQGNTLERARHAAERLVGPSLYWLPLALGGAMLAVLALAPLLGAGWALWKERGAAPATALLLAVFAVGVGGYTLLSAPAGVEGVFFVYGYIALLPVAALGLVGLWGRTPATVRERTARACAALLALAVAVAALSAALPLAGIARGAWLVAAYAAVAGGVAVAGRVAAAGWRAAGWPWQGAGGMPVSRRTRVVACALPLLVTLALVKPLTLVGAGGWRTVVGKPTSTADTAATYGLTAALYRGLLWVRAHTTACDVLAVNNHYDAAGEKGAAYVYYSAFTERRVYLESWFYTPEGQSGIQPYPARFALNEAALRGRPGALRELARRGVSYVLIDKTHPNGTVRLASGSTLVYSRPALDVYRLAVAGHRGCAAVT